MDNILLKVKGISKEIENKTVLKNINFDVHNEEFVCIVGPSGCGKSTLLRIIDGLETAETGGVFLQSEQIKKPTTKMGFVFQNFELLPWKTVQENVELGLLSLNLSKEETIKRAKKYLDVVGLLDFAHAYPRELSGGMKQRVGLARALAIEPELILMDEPFSALDDFTANYLRKKLLEILENENIEVNSVVMVTHNVAEAVFLADRVLVMSKMPGTVIDDIKIKLPRPRLHHNPEFIKYEERIENILRRTGAIHSTHK